MAQSKAIEVLGWMLTLSVFYEELPGQAKNLSNGVRRQCTEQGWLKAYGVKEVKDAGRYLHLFPDHDSGSTVSREGRVRDCLKHRKD